MDYKKEDYIKFLDKISDRYGNRIVDFLDKYKLMGLSEASIYQLKEYCEHTTEWKSYNKQSSEEYIL